MIYFTSDTHAGDSNIIRFAKRPFSTVDEMNEALIDNWNSVVGPDDEVYHLGDIAFGSKKFVTEFVSRLNGTIHLVMGNHDYRNIWNAKLQHLFADVSMGSSLVWNHHRIHLSHYPFLCWTGRYHSEPQLHGHMHLRQGYDGCDRKLMDEVASCNQYDVGVDLNNMRPISIEEAWEKLRLQCESNLNCYNMWCKGTPISMPKSTD